jgi:hypothetical protein
MAAIVYLSGLERTTSKRGRIPDMCKEHSLFQNRIFLGVIIAVIVLIALAVATGIIR